MNRKIVSENRVSTAQELIDILKSLAGNNRVLVSDVVRLDTCQTENADGYDVRVTEVEETLSDGSTVTNFVLT